jgi:hypothetical protein
VGDKKETEMKKVLMLLLLVFPLSSFGDFYNGNELMTKSEDCDKYDAGDRTMDNYWSCGAFANYIAGVDDTYRTLVVREGFEPKFCASESVTVGQMVKIVRKHLDMYPEKLHMAASGLVLNALEAAFPCP